MPPITRGAAPAQVVPQQRDGAKLGNDETFVPTQHRIVPGAHRPGRPEGRSIVYARDTMELAVDEHLVGLVRDVDNRRDRASQSPAGARILCPPPRMGSISASSGSRSLILKPLSSSWAYSSTFSRHTAGVGRWVDGGDVGGDGGDHLDDRHDRFPACWSCDGAGGTVTMWASTPIMSPRLMPATRSRGLWAPT
jgi:hypothetical protein